MTLALSLCHQPPFPPLFSLFIHGSMGDSRIAVHRTTKDSDPSISSLVPTNLPPLITSLNWYGWASYNYISAEQP